MKRIMLLILILSVLAAGCTQENPPVQTQPSADASIDGDAVPGFSVEEIPLDLALTDTQSLYLLDAKDSRLLFTVWDKQINYATTGSSRYTSSVFIFNADTGEIEKLWEPEIPGQYQSGILTGTDSALCCVCTDIESPAGNYADHIVLLNSNQTIVAQVDGMLSAPSELDENTILVPYENYADGISTYGLLCLSDGSVSDRFSWMENQMDSVQISAYGSSFCFIQDTGEKSCFVTADGNGELYRSVFDPSTEKIDSFCLTAQGVLASMQTDTGHSCILFSLDGTRSVLEDPGFDSGLYRLRANQAATLAVDGQYQLYALTVRNGQLSLQSITEDLLPKGAGAISLRTFGEDGFWLYYGSIPALYRVAVTGS